MKVKIEVDGVSSSFEVRSEKLDYVRIFIEESGAVSVNAFHFDDEDEEARYIGREVVLDE